MDQNSARYYLKNEIKPEELIGGRFEKESCCEYGYFTGYDIVFVSAKGERTILAKDVSTGLANFIADSLKD